MIGPSGTVRVMVATKPVDFRKGMEGLAMLVREHVPSAGGLDPPGIAYVYAPDRKAERLFSHLAGFKGVLQVDGYNAYPKLAERGEVELAFCWVHMRRNFYELATAGPRRSRARR